MTQRTVFDGVIRFPVDRQARWDVTPALPEHLPDPEPDPELARTRLAVVAELLAVAMRDLNARTAKNKPRKGAAKRFRLLRQEFEQLTTGNPP